MTRRSLFQSLTALLGLGAPPKIVPLVAKLPPVIPGCVAPKSVAAVGPQIFFVHTSGGNYVGHGLGWHLPFATLAYAMEQVEDGRGDTIYLLSGHKETLPRGGLSLDKAGVSIMGLDAVHGAPQFHTDGGPAFNLNADGISLQNVILMTDEHPERDRR